MTFAKFRWSGAVHDFEPSRGIGTQIHFRGLCAGMTEPQGHLSNVTRRLQDHRDAAGLLRPHTDPVRNQCFDPQSRRAVTLIGSRARRALCSAIDECCSRSFRPRFARLELDRTPIEANQVDQ
jgi:hypothetical protein